MKERKRGRGKKERTNQLAVYFSKFLLVADTQLYKRLCPSVRPSVRWSVRGHQVEKV